MESKKTALDLACRYIVKLDMSLHSNDSKIQPYYCKENHCKSKSAAKCVKCCKRYFNQQADIPDGWEVVKEIYRNIKNELCGYPESDVYMAKDFVESKLQQAGIEAE